MSEDQLKEIARLSIAVRDAQKAYFKDRTKENLVKARTLEAALDKALTADIRRMVGQKDAAA